jgi:Cys-rich protein (TIGR01571 family)
VKHGERFSSHAIVDADDNDESPFSSDSTPVGDWRDGLFDCFQLGLCHPLVCLSWWCYPIALGQVLTRLKLDWFGSPTDDKVPREWSAFRVISLVWIAYAAFHYTVGVVSFPYSANGTKSDDPPLWSTVLMGADNGLSVAFSLYTLIVMVRARSYVRAKYSIPERDCAGCEDCCFSYFCHCCVVAQMARHINDYERYPADCCSETGLAAAAPELV